MNKQKSNDTVKHGFFSPVLALLKLCYFSLLPCLTLIQLLVSGFLSTVSSVLGSSADSSAD